MLRIPPLILLLLFFETCSAQPDPVKNFCRRFGHQTAVIDRKLYIDGGFINYSPLSQYPTNYTNLGLHYHDLDTPGPGLMPQLYANLTKNSTIPSVNGGTLWADDINKRFYLFGGEYHQQPPSPEFTLWSYDTIYEKWESFGSPAQDDIGAVSYGAGVSVPETGVGYYYGGWMSNSTVPGWTDPPEAMSRLVKYNMDSNTWSTDPGPDSIGRAEGVMVFLPIGDGGMLVYLGGVQDIHGNGSWVGQPTETIFLYDVLSSKWYTQNATGTAPPMRRRFCGGATWAPDQSSYNIYIYGGASMPPATSGFDDIYVLSIPSFQWIKMFPLDRNGTGDYPHHSLSCNIIDGAQMMIIGGTFPTSDRCDVPDQHGVHNADLGEQNEEKAIWQIFATNITKYAVPDAIISAVGGSAGGGATKTAPDDGFSSPDLRVLMTRKANIPKRTPTRAIPSATGSPEQDHSLSSGEIAGIAVGSVVGLIALLAAVIFLIRRRRRRRRQGGNPLHIQPSDSQRKDPPTSPYEWSHHAPSPAPYTPTSPYPHSPFRHQNANGYPANRPVELPGNRGSSSPPPPGAVPGMTTTWLSQDGITYELVSPALVHQYQQHPQFYQQLHHPHHHSSTSHIPLSGSIHDSGVGSSPETGTGTNSSNGEQLPPPAPPIKIDAEGRLWVQVSPSQVLHTTISGGANNNSGGSPHSGGGGGGGGGGMSPGLSPGFGFGGGYHQAQMMYSPVTPGSVAVTTPSEPQELSGEPKRECSGGGFHSLGGEEEIKRMVEDAPLREGAGWDAAHGRPRHLTFYHP